MGQGLQAWNAAGQLVFDSSTRTTRLAGVVTVTTNGTGTFVYTPSAGKELFLYTLQAGTVRFCDVHTIPDGLIEYQIQGLVSGSQVNIFYGER